MRVPQTVSDFFQWRWAPCVGLTAGSLAFVALALLLIPTRFEAEPRADTTLGAFDHPQPQRAVYATALGRSLTEPEDRPENEPGAVSVPNETGTRSAQTSAGLRRGFSPIVDRPEAPAPAPAIDAPAPPPGSVIITQPTPGGESAIGQ